MIVMQTSMKHRNKTISSEGNQVILLGYDKQIHYFLSLIFETLGDPNKNLVLLSDQAVQ